MTEHRIKGKIKSKRMNVQDWLDKHFKKMVNKYGGKHLIICGEETFIGKDVNQLCIEARTKHPNATLISMPIPRKEDLVSILIICPKS